MQEPMQTYDFGSRTPCVEESVEHINVISKLRHPTVISLFSLSTGLFHETKQKRDLFYNDIGRMDTIAMIKRLHQTAQLSERLPICKDSNF